MRNNHRVTAIIVTYQNRGHLVRRVINAALAQNVYKIIIIDNASVKESADVINNMVDNHEKIHLIRHEINEGSAGGFHAGLEYVMDHIETDFIWLLDDDNVPQKNSLTNLFKAYDLVIGAEINQAVLYSYRGNTRALDYKAVTSGIVKDYKNNNFMGLNFVTLIKRKLFKIKCGDKINYPLVRTKFGPYGGMFFSTDTLHKVGLPNKELYLYADDHEYSLRFNELEIIQYVVYASKLEDIDISFSGENIFFSKKSSDLKIFYMVRNHVYLSKRFITSNVIYSFNKMIFIFIFFWKSLKFIFKDYKHVLARINLIKKAIENGEEGRLGKLKR